MTATPRPDRRRQRTRAALIEAGRRLFAARSVEAVTIDDIVAAADVAKGSFYNHFPDREALAREVAAEIRQRVEFAAAEVNQDVADPAERVARALVMFVRQAGVDPQSVAASLRLFDAGGVPDAPMNAGVRADIQAGLAAGRFTDIPLAAAVLMAVGLVQVGVARVLQGDQAAPPRTVAHDLAFGLLRGLGLPTPEAAALAGRAVDDLCGPPPPHA